MVIAMVVGALVVEGVVVVPTMIQDQQFSGEFAVVASALFPLPNTLSGGRWRRGVGAGIWCCVLLETTE